MSITSYVSKRRKYLVTCFGGPIKIKIWKCRSLLKMMSYVKHCVVSHLFHLQWRGVQETRTQGHVWCIQWSEQPRRSSPRKDNDVIYIAHKKMKEAYITPTSFLKRSREPLLNLKLAHITPATLQNWKNGTILLPRVTSTNSPIETTLYGRGGVLSSFA
jgi:hypothetical protein